MSAITELEELVTKAKDSYYNTGKFLKVSLKLKYKNAYMALVNADPKLWKDKVSVISITDELYDSIEDTLKSLKPKSKALTVGAPVTKQKVELPFFMGSLDKIKPGSVDKWLKTHKGPYIVMDKEDGLSIGMEYKAQRKAYTRGNGSVGQDITYLLPHLKAPAKSKFKELRGEIIMDKSVFDSKWGEDFENPRNMASGLVNRKDIHKAVKDIDVIIYEVISPRGVPSEQLKELKAEGFNVVPHKVFKTLTEQDLIDYYTERRKKSKYDIDGLVVMQDKKNPANESGNPDFAVAFKMASEGNEAIAEVVRVEWNASKHGFLKPRCEIKPVRLAGVTVKYATCHNAAFIRDNGIGPGAQVKITRSGEVIPYILDVVKKVKPSLPSTKEFGDWEWNETEVDIVLSNPVENDSVAVKQITHFFRTLEVENFSEGLVARFYEHGFDTIEKIIKMKKSDMLKVEGIQARMAEKIYKNIHDALEDVYLPSIMDASGIFGRNFGTRRIEGIMDEYYPDVMDWGKMKPALIKAKVMRVAGFKDTLAEQFANNLGKFIAWFDKLGLDYHYNEDDEDSEPESDKLSGQRIYITGFRDAELSDIIERNGGEETSGFNSKTTVLIVKDKTTSNTKTDNAKKAGVPVLTKDEFLKKFKL